MMFSRLAKAVGLLLWLAITIAAVADERIGAFVVFDSLQDQILLDGDIGINAPLEFRRAMSARPDAKVLVLGSPGGYVASALIIADEVHSRGMSTVIPEDASCFSACSFIFLAGNERRVDGQLGVHQMIGEQDIAGVQTTMSDIIEALEQFNTPTEVITRMLRTPNEEMYVFSAAEIESLAINRAGTLVSTTTDSSKAIVPPTTSGAKVFEGGRTEIPREPPPREIEPVQADHSFGPRIVLYGGLDFYGNDRSSERTRDVVQCAAACMSDDLCQAFTYNADPDLTRGPNCFLKTNVDRLEGYANALSGVFLPAGNEPAATYSIGAIDPTRDVLPRQGLSGKDFSSSPERGIDSPGECRMACVDNTACRAFTYDSRLKQCYLKHAVGKQFSSSRLTSGIKRGASFKPLDVIDLEE